MADDGPPPLEDMTEQLLERAKCQGNKLHPQPTVQLPKDAATAVHEKETRTKRKETNTGGEFGGLRKGFLSGSAVASKGVKAKVQSSSTGGGAVDDDIIRPKQKTSKSSGLEFPEVQETMKESFPFLNTQDWMTDNLLSKVEEDPVLSKAFHDPAMVQALAQFQTNPQLALAAAKDKPEIQKFLQSFCALMGDHFTELGKAEERTRAPVSEIVPHEEAQMKEILLKPEVAKVLQDPAIQNLIQTLKTDPIAAQQLLRSSSPNLKLKIRVLIDHGLLAIQQT